MDKWVDVFWLDVMGEVICRAENSTLRKVSPLTHLGPSSWQMSMFLSEEGPKVISVWI